MATTRQLVGTLGCLNVVSVALMIGVSDRALAQQEDGPRFLCQVENGQPTVMYSPISQPGEVYPWATPGDLGSAWPAERRCNEISRRLESYRPDGLLELQTGLENGYDTVCVTTENDASCRIVFTVPPGQDPLVTRDSVFNNLALADQGQTTEGVITFQDGSTVLDDLENVLGLPSGNTSARRNRSINLQPFLDPRDGGTGSQLNRSPGRSLNPDNF
ncbi:MAG: COP23 domain-containing protein [Cyanobacteria bacterium J06638_28]